MQQSANLEPLQLAAVSLLALFLIFISIAYWRYGRPIRELEVERVLNQLKIDDVEKKRYLEKRGSIVTATIFAVVSFGLLGFLAAYGEEFPWIVFGDRIFPIVGSQLVLGVALLGAYVWGINHIFKRYSVNNLNSVVYYRLIARMILASVVAVVIFNTSDIFIEVQSELLWIPIALFIGMFPQRAWQSVMERLPALFTATDPSVKKLPLEMIQGIQMDDRLRLEEEGIYTCYHLANHDFIPLLLSTHYSARQLVDWILQARLCVYVGEAVRALREHGIRRVTDLKAEDIDEIATKTTATKLSLEAAHKWAQDNRTSVKRLLAAAQQASTFLEGDSKAIGRAAH